MSCWPAEKEPGAPTWADRVLDHPALARVAHRMHRATFPSRSPSAAALSSSRSREMLARARRETLEARA